MSLLRDHTRMPMPRMDRTLILADLERVITELATALPEGAVQDISFEGVSARISWRMKPRELHAIALELSGLNA